MTISTSTGHVHAGRSGGASKVQLTEERYLRLLTYLREDEGCLIWTGSVDTRGYGRYLHKRVHRLYWEYHNGAIPPGTEMAHSCNRKLCVRHVRPKTHKENLQEYSGKALKQMCKRNLHEMTPENVYAAPSRPANRRCRECNKIDQRLLYWRKAGLSEEEAVARSGLEP
jgi:hypothetical protein